MAKAPKQDKDRPEFLDDAEVEVSLCCDSMLDAIQSGGVQVVEVSPGEYREVIPDENGKTGIAINYCPFCGLSKLSDLPE